MKNTITYRTTYETVTPESAENGECSDQGFVNEEGTPATFRELVRLLRGTEPSCWPVPATCEENNLWYTAPSSTDYRTGEETSESFHPVDGRAGRYMLKAWKYANAKR